jgi:hypothetical protein
MPALWACRGKNESGHVGSIGEVLPKPVVTSAFGSTTVHGILHLLDACTKNGRARLPLTNTLGCPVILETTKDCCILPKLYAQELAIAVQPLTYKAQGTLAVRRGLFHQRAITRRECLNATANGTRWYHLIYIALQRTSEILVGRGIVYICARHFFTSHTALIQTVINSELVCPLLLTECIAIPHGAPAYLCLHCEWIHLVLCRHGTEQRVRRER